jgi:parallel beta-helix repeat protein
MPKFISFLFFMIIMGSAHATTYYVSTAGNNSYSGLTSGDAFLTLQFASDLVQAGDSVIVMVGAYTGFYHTTSGTASSRIVFHANQSVVISSPNGITDDGINLEGASFVTVEGFIISGMPRAGIRSVTNTDVIIQNNICSYSGYWGILTGFSENITIRFNTCNNSIEEHGIYVGNSADNPVIHGNICYNNNANGIHINADASLGGDGIISHATVTANYIYNNGAAGGSGINCDGVQNSYIANNILFNNHASGISLYKIDAAEPSNGTVVVNNTVYQPVDGRWALNITNGCADVIAFNNILLSDHPFRGSITADPTVLQTLISGFNIVENRMSLDDGETVVSLATWTTQTDLDTQSLLGDPDLIFVNVFQNDYHLLPNCIAVDAGAFSIATSNAPLVDYYGTPRPTGSNNDIGAVEFAASDWIQGIEQAPILEWKTIAFNAQISIFTPGGQLVFQGYKSDFVLSENRIGLWLFNCNLGSGKVLLIR